MVVLRDSNKNPDVVMLVYCTTQNKSLEYECIEVLEGTEEFYNMGLTKSTYIVPGIIKPIDVTTVIEPIGYCSRMNDIDKIISKIF